MYKHVVVKGMSSLEENMDDCEANKYGKKVRNCFLHHMNRNTKTKIGAHDLSFLLKQQSLWMIKEMRVKNNNRD